MIRGRATLAIYHGNIHGLLILLKLGFELPHSSSKSQTVLQYFPDRLGIANPHVPVFQRKLFLAKPVRDLWYGHRRSIAPANNRWAQDHLPHPSRYRYEPRRQHHAAQDSFLRAKPVHSCRYCIHASLIQALWINSIM